jgi:hypothetical protein
LQVVPEIGHGGFEPLLAKVQGIEELTVLGIHGIWGLVFWQN